MNKSHYRTPWLTLYLVMAIVLFAMGVSGFSRYAAWHKIPGTIFDYVYLTLQLIPMNSGAVEPPVPLELELARFLIPLLTATAAVQAFLRIFREQIQMARLPWMRQHIIICGLSRKGFLLASRFRRQGKKVVVIEQDEENAWLASCREQGMVVLVGDASDPTLLDKAGVARAEGLFAVCEDDGVNVEIALQAQALAQRHQDHVLICQMHISDPQMCALLREQRDALAQTSFRLELFNVFERAAQTLLLEHPAWPGGAALAGRPPHVLIVGLGRMGENLALHMARAWWNERAGADVKLRLTVIDRAARQKAASLLIRYPQLERACDLTVLDIDIHSPEFERGDFLFGVDHQPCVTAVYVCVDNDSLGLQAGLALARLLDDQDIPIVVRLVEDNGLARILELSSNDAGGRSLREGKLCGSNLHAFGYLEHTCTPDLLKNTPREQLARLAHEVYVQEQIQLGRLPQEDPALRPWHELAAEYRKANDQWAGHIPLLLDAVGYTYAPLKDWDAPAYQFSEGQVECMAQLEHELWCRDRFAEGWQYAPGKKDLKARNNPALVPWERLPEPERQKNRVMVAGIPGLLGRAGFQVVEKNCYHRGNHS